MFAQQIVNGLTLGILYSLMATGLTIIFGLMRVVNFAHGEFYMLGAYFTIFFLAYFGMPWFWAVLLAAVATFIFGYLSDKYLLKPLRNASSIRKALLMIGFSFFLANVVNSIAGGKSRDIPFPLEGNLNLFGVILSIELLMLVGITLVVFGVLYLILFKTKLGKSMRATFQNEEMAALVGISVNQINYLTFGVGSMMAGISGALLGTHFLANPTMGTAAIGKSFIAVIMGGFGSMPGAVVGGLLLGLIENLGSAYISSQFKDIFGFIAVIIILLFKPKGLLINEK